MDLSSTQISTYVVLVPNLRLHEGAVADRSSCYNDDTKLHFSVLVQKLVKFIKDTCNPRFHWAKAGWPRYFSCYDGAAYFPEMWCDFGCAVEVTDMECHPKMKAAAHNSAPPEMVRSTVAGYHA